MSDVVVITQIADLLLIDEAPAEAVISSSVLTSLEGFQLVLAPSSLIRIVAANGAVVYEVETYDFTTGNMRCRKVEVCDAPGKACEDG